MVDTIKFSQMTNAGNIKNNDIMPSLRSGENVILDNPWTFLPSGTTAQRPAPSVDINYRLRLNTDTQLYEYYNAVLMVWTQIEESAVTDGPFITYTADVSLPQAQNLGALANGILKQTITTGIATLDIAVNGTDYYGPGFVIPGTDGGTGINNGARTINLGSPTTGYVLTSDVSGNATWQSVAASGGITTINGNTGSATPTAGVVTITGASTGLTFTGSGSTLTLGGILLPVNGGTGVASPTAHGILVGEGASPVTPIVLTSGQILIGSTGVDPVAAAIGSGTGILVGNGAGSITVSLADIATLTGLVNTTGGSAAPIATTLTAWIDAALGSTQGNVLYRNASAWVVLAPGTSGQFLQTLGAASNVQWASGNAGTVTSIATNNGITGGTITTTGTIGLAAIADHTLLANISGGSLAPSSTTLTALIDNAIGSTQGDILYRNATQWVVLAPGTSGQFLQTQGAAQNPIWAPGDGAGTVTSVGTGTGLTGGTITSSGTISFASIAANSLWVNNTSGAAVPTVVGLAALTKTDDTNVTLTLGGTPTTALINATSLTLGWTGQLGLTRGGTNASLTASNGGIVYSGSSALAILAGTATAGLALLSGASGTPSWSTLPPITRVNVQIITTTGAYTYTPSAGIVYAILEMQAAGGGSGGSTGTAGQSAMPAAAGAGAYMKLYITAANIGASITGNIGAAGAAGASGANTGGTGGSTTAVINSSTWTAAGGVGGAGIASSASPQNSPIGGAGGTNTTGANATLMLAVAGQNGGAGFSNGATAVFNISGAGGNSALGAGGAVYNVNTPSGTPGTGYGSGAGSGFNGNGNNQPGVAGQQGIVIVTEFISA